MSDQREEVFRFEISLSVLNHLGRNLYRNFITVLGEAISNAWDADAKNVWIDIERETSRFSIKDDGIGMSAEDFQTKFLKIGYSKRSDGSTRSDRRRPYIGAKGIGKLALLSCAKRVSIITKREDTDYVGGVIDNSGLDNAITQDLTPQEYPLENLDIGLFGALTKDHRHGTIIVFEDAKEQIRNSIAHIRKMIALSFKFALIDNEFSIFVNGEEVTLKDIQDVLDATEFVWLINEADDLFVSAMKKLKADPLRLTTTLSVSGFIASVEKPRDLKITGTDDRATIDLFVNGRLREKNILRHVPTQRLVESYIYGQIHFDAMDTDTKVDPFTSSREGVVEDDKNFVSLLDYLKRGVLPEIIDQWDELRLDRGKEGDDENPRKSKKQRKARDLYAATRDEFEPANDAETKDEVDGWLDGLRNDAEFNISSYVDCFLSENLLREYVRAHKLSLDKAAPAEIQKWKGIEAKRKGEANISFDVRRDTDGLSFLDLDLLALSVEGSKTTNGNQSLWTDSIAYKPVRNVVGHTGLLTSNAKNHLSLTFENIKARVKTLISNRPKKST
ncbi:DNA mismatch repair protein [Mesorhizobium erdmanii]|uniref:DNA mismatch repair protein n=2 Tax=Mesorhizobium TaxID=68287 RepID=A0A3M9XGV9_9HYPH|nr:MULTISPECIES: ATP-binding protein [Mesorhizobium]RNJ47036.1 DNA mismatch repair protein [Mesorhizobium japonicum]RXT33961.1 DNA mismatch repair protein [Mesorhizobium erdmanii]